MNRAVHLIDIDIAAESDEKVSECHMLRFRSPQDIFALRLRWNFATLFLLPHQSPMMRSETAMQGYEAMALPLRFFFLFQRFAKSLLLFFCLLVSLTPAWASNEIAFTFDNADIQTVIKKVGEFTGTTFLFDPTKVHGKITILSPQKISPEGALQLLESALALHGYTFLRKEEGIWVMPQSQVTQAAKVIEVVPLQYAKAEEVADTLAWIAPPGVRIVPYLPTNSLIISGDAEAVKQLIDTLK